MLEGGWALLSGISSGPLGLFAVALAVSCILTAVLLVLGHGAKQSLNRHYTMPKSKEDER